MAGIRDIKRVSRQRLHTALAVRALYIPVTGATPVPVTVRVHTKFDATGDPQMMQRADIEPRLVFQASQLPVNGLRTHAVVSVEAGEAYHIEAADPMDDAGFVTARVKRLSATQTVNLPVPPPVTA